MNSKLILLKPYFDEKIWGGKKLEKFGFKLPNSNIGEALIISALKNKSSLIINKEFESLNLYDFFDLYRKDFFGNYHGEYPLLTKIIDANSDLSVQVHPNNEYARKYHNKLGKEECWYILDCENDSYIIYGHNLRSKSELLKSIDEKTILNKLNRIYVKKDDFYYVPSGMIHAIGKGNLIFELQQSSDITYRLYDYERKDNDGNFRELHIKECLDNINFENKNIKIEKDKNYLVNNSFFKLKKITLDGTYIHIPNNSWTQGTIIDGFCEIDGILCNKGSSFLYKFNEKLYLNGKGIILLSWI